MNSKMNSVFATMMSMGKQDLMLMDPALIPPPIVERTDPEYLFFKELRLEKMR